MGNRIIQFWSFWCDVRGKWIGLCDQKVERRDEQVIVLPASDYDALMRRVAELEAGLARVKGDTT